VNSFKHRLLILIVSLVVFAEGVTVVLALVYLNRGVRAESAAQLTAARAMLERSLDVRSQQLRSAAEVLVADFAFREAATSGDRPTTLSALSNHAHRIDAAVAMLYDAEGRILATTLPDTLRRDLHLPAPATLGDEPAFVVINGQPHQLVYAPLRAPEIIGWVALGFALDQKLAQQLRGLAGSEVTFVARADDSTVSRVISTMPDAAAQWASRPLPDFSTADTPVIAELNGEQYLTLSTALPVRNGHIDLVLQRSLDVALARFREMWLALLLISGATLLAAIGVGWFAGRSAIRPLANLVAAARRIARGQYNDDVAIAGDQEFRELATSFIAMQTGIREREQRILEQATRDSLTGLANRFALRDRLEARQRSDDPFSVALIDVHRFRDLNASVGHHVGDQLLQTLAQRFLSLAGSLDYCARVGVDQFMVGTPLHDTELLHRVLVMADELRRGVNVERLQINIEIRVGIAEWRAPHVPVDDLLRQADVALVEAKARNSQAVVYEPGHDAEHRRRIMLVAELRRAIADGSLTLAYQPLVTMTNREPVMLEALLRWQHPRLGNISPAEFVPLAERASVIGDLSRWVLDAAIGQLGRWRREGLEVALAVNLSAPDIADGELPGRVLTLLQQRQVQPSQLLLEVTESTIMSEPALAAQVMQRLRTVGVRFAIDDFGTGHSSLAQLHSLPVDELKIDRAFVLNLERNASNQAIVRSTTELAHSLGLKVVAEGVETPEVWTALLRLGCDLAQGYFISRPMPQAEVLGWMRTQRANLSQALSEAQEDGSVAALRGRSGERQPV